MGKRILLKANIGALAAFFIYAVAATVLGAQNTDRSAESICFQEEGEKAIAACQQSLKNNPRSLKRMKRLADLLLEAERFDEALQLLADARKAYPHNQRIAHKIKLTKSMQAEKILFAEEDERSQSSAENQTAQRQTQSKLSRLLCLRMKGDRGLAACQLATEAFPKDAAVHKAYGDLLKAAGQAEKARQAYQVAERLQPQKQSVAQAVSPAPPPKPLTLAAKTPVPEKPKANPPPKPASPRTEGPSLADKLRQLKALQAQGLIDDNEYRQRKRSMMDQAFGRTSSKSPSAKGKTGRLLPEIEFGQYHALVIGVQNYQHLTKLEMAHNDAQAVSKLLQESYGYRVNLLKDPTRRDMLMALGKMRRTLNKQDNLLIYYAGHGWLDRDADTGYWMPVDAASDNDIEWLSLNSITSAARAIPAKHIMIVADSCYSGKLTRGLNIQQRASDHLNKMASRRARVVLTSGGLEPVLDAGGGNHSVFAAIFLDILKGNDSIIDGTTLFSRLRRDVMLKASQTPEYSDIRKAGHEGGDFLFVRKPSAK